MHRHHTGFLAEPEIMKGFLGLTPARHFLQFDPLRMCASRRRSAVMSYRVAFKLVMEVIELTSMSQRAGSIVAIGNAWNLSTPGDP